MARQPVHGSNKAKNIQYFFKADDATDVSCVQSLYSGKVTVQTMEVSNFCDWPDCASIYKPNMVKPH